MPVERGAISCASDGQIAAEGMLSAEADGNGTARAQVLHGDCLEVLPTLAAESVDAVCTDPPYHLTSGKRGGSGEASLNLASPAGRSRITTGGFMGCKWDGGDVAFRPETWAAVARVMKPGAHLVAFGGTRTYHRLACAIEDAGFEIRDAIMWHYGSGFPKSHDVSKAIDKAAGAARTETGEIVRAGCRAARAGKELVGAESIEAFKWKSVTSPATDAARQWAGWGTALKPATEIIVLARKPLSELGVAANVLRWGTGAINIDGCRVECKPIKTIQGQSSRQQNGEMYSGRDQRDKAEFNSHPAGRWPANCVHDGSPEVMEAFARFETAGNSFRTSRNHQGGNLGWRAGNGLGVDDSGTAARFFYSAKAGPDDRLGSRHPTCKPVALMRWLVRLITPPNGRVLDCFAGSGTTGMACLAEGFDCTLIEREEIYVADIKARLAHVHGDDTPLFAVPADDEQLEMFAA